MLKLSKPQRRKAQVPEVNDGHASYEDTVDFAHQFYASLNTPRSLTCSLLLKYNEIDQLVNLSCDPNGYLDWKSYYEAALATNLLRKFKFRSKKHPGWKSSARRVALETLLNCERSCREANDRILKGQLSANCTRVLNRARALIKRWLGPFDAMAWSQECSFGPGSDLLNKADRATLYDKMVKDPTVGVDFYHLAMCLVQSSPSWADACKRIRPVLHNRVTFVDKDAKTDRPIAIEPTLNIYAQLGIGQLIRKRLRRIGIDLSTQLVNQNLAWLGSRDDFLCTIDLSSASDTVSYFVVEALLPPDWFHALDLTRSKQGLLPDGTVLTYEKFSSMGNGYTFELETLIFHALNVATQMYHSALPPLSYVYGDDIIAPSVVYHQLTEIFAELGFTVNRKKSYCTGPFRESCGRDFYAGQNVRSWYLKEPLRDLASVYKAANSISRVAYYLGSCALRDATLEACYRSLVRLTKRWKDGRRCVGPFIPDEWGDPAPVDSHLSVCISEAFRRRIAHRWGRGWDAWSYHTLRARSKQFRFEGRSGDYVVALFLSKNGCSKPSYGKLMVRQQRPLYTVRREAIQDWSSAPPWL